MNIETASRLCQNDPDFEGSILLEQYMREVEPTDKLPKDKAATRPDGLVR